MKLKKEVKIWLFVLFFIGAVILGFFVIRNLFTNNEKKDTEVPIVKKSDLCNDVDMLEGEIVLFVNNEIININLSENKIYNALKLSSEIMNEVVVCNNEGYNVSLDGNLLEESVLFDLKLSKLSDDEFITLNINSEVFNENFLIRTLHENINFTVTGESSSGFYYFDYNDAAVKTNSKGEVVTYIMGDFVRNFKRNEIGDNVYYTYLESALEDDYDNIKIDGAAHMNLVVLDHNYNEIDRIKYLSSDNGIQERHSIENHDYQMIGLGHYIVTSYVASTVYDVPSELIKISDTDVKVGAAVFQEIKDGELVFEFNSVNYPELYAYSTLNNEYGIDNYEDYLHINSVIVDNDNNYMVSLRNMDSILKVNKYNGDIMWILGGLGDEFNIGEYQFSRQHYAIPSLNGTISVYDNGRDFAQSRVIEYKLNEDTKEIIDANIYQLDGYFGKIRGSAERLHESDNIFLFAWGETQSNKAFITEYNFDSNNKVIEFYDGTDDSKNYRAFKFNY